MHAGTTASRPHKSYAHTRVSIYFYTPGKGACRQDPVLNPTHQETQGCPGADCWTATGTPAVGYTRTYIHTQRDSHCPQLQHRQCQLCLRGQYKCSFCQLHRRIHDQSNKNKQGGPVSHGLTDQHVEKGRRSAALSIHPSLRGATLRARKGQAGPPNSVGVPAPTPLAGGLNPKGQVLGGHVSPQTNSCTSGHSTSTSSPDWPTYSQNAQRQS